MSKVLKFEVVYRGKVRQVEIPRIPWTPHKVKLEGEVIGTVRWVKPNMCIAATLDDEVKIERRTLEEAGAGLVLHHLHSMGKDD